MNAFCDMRMNDLRHISRSHRKFVTWQEVLLGMCLSHVTYEGVMLYMDVSLQGVLLGSVDVKESCNIWM